MSLRKAYAATLQLLRNRKGLYQHQAAGKIDQSHVSRLEAGKSSATVNSTVELANALGIEPLSFLALVFAAQHQLPARQVLLTTLAQLERLELADAVLPVEPLQLPSPLIEDARQKWAAVQELKRAGVSQIEAASSLGLPKSTVGRLWHKIYEDA